MWLTYTLEILYGWADDHLIGFHLVGLLDCVSDRSRDRAGRVAICKNSRKFFLFASVDLLSSALWQLRRGREMSAEQYQVTPCGLNC